MNLHRMESIAYDLRPAASERSRRQALEDINALAPFEQRHWKPRLARLLQQGEPTATGGIYYQDTKPPWILADTATVTLTTAQQNLWTPAEFTQTFPSDWFPGKQFLVRAFGRMTTPATAGAVTIEFGYGATTGTTTLASSAALAVVASQTNMSWRFEGRVRCRQVTLGAASAGILIGTGIFECNTALLAAGQALIPATAAAQITGVNLNQTSGIRLAMTEAATSGGTVVVHDLEWVAQN